MGDSFFPNDDNGDGNDDRILNDESDVEEDSIDEIEDETAFGEEAEEEGTGEDLLGDNMMNDYIRIPELDNYDSEMIDDSVYSNDMSARRSAEEEMKRNSFVPQNKENKKGLFPFVDEDIFDDYSQSQGTTEEQRSNNSQRIYGNSDHHLNSNNRNLNDLGDDDMHGVNEDGNLFPGEGVEHMMERTGGNDDKDRRGKLLEKKRELERLRRMQDEDEDDDDADDMNLNNEDFSNETDFSEGSRLAVKIKRNFWKFLSSFMDPTHNASSPLYSEKIHNMCAENGNSISVAFYPHLSDWSPALSQLICEYPLKILPLLDASATQYTKKLYKEMFADEHIEINVRIDQFPLLDRIRNLRSSNINKMIAIKGVVTRRSTVFPRLRILYLNCGHCSFVCGPFQVPDDEDEAVKPGHCPECQSPGPFTVNREMTVYRNFQILTTQESPGSVPPGRMPRAVQVILSGDLVDSVRPGDQVHIVGVYVAKFDVIFNSRSGFPVFRTSVVCNSIVRENELKLEEISDADKEAIFQLSKDPLIRNRIIHSMAPSVFGCLDMKTALAMSLFGGREKVAHGKHRIRGDINVLLLGDPGLAKSQCLKYVNTTFHRSVYTTGKGASAVGLTASVRRDNQTGEYTLEGGALVLADSGICLIDEFDKMNEQDRTSIHEAMEQQSISISKAGIVTTLEAKCSVVAAANPIGGRYNASISFSENVDLTEPILSRFDILCVLKDEIDIIEDERLADFVVCSHMKNHPTFPDPDVKCHHMNNSGSHYDPISQDILRKYILFARKHVFPRISPSHANKLGSFYRDIRSAGNQGMLLTVRHLESLIRMSEASAKMELRDFVTSTDVDNAISTMLRSFIQTQKHSVANRLEKKFQARYINTAADQQQLIHFLLRKLFKQEINKNISNETHNPEEVAIGIDNLTMVALQSDLNGGEINNYLQSSTFKDMFVLDATGKNIERKVLE